jgi:phosphoribosyl 1,2-cyclic phosphodiesterase
MEITFWGVRGSIASPGPDTIGVGGNTSCVEVRCGSQKLIFDAGTGIRRLGDKLLSEGSVDATLLLSHMHWDHIQGIPFFGPAYVPSSRLSIVGGTNGVMPLRDALAYQMSAPVFPVRLDELGAKIDWREVKPGERFHVGDVEVRVARQNHPGGSYAYRLDYKGRSVVYATDTEHYACVDPALCALARGADVLIYDSQYTPEEYRGSAPGNSKVGWGHSTYVAGVELARAADVGQYVLFHHDPRRSDAGVDEIERRTRELFPHAIAAREGLTLGLLPVAKAA